MAAEGEERMVVADAGGGGGDGEGTYMFPEGVRFVPTDEELVKFYLLPKLQGRPTVPNNAIIEANAYEFHPATLVHGKYRYGGEGAWFFLFRRTRVSRKVVRRRTEDGCGRWKQLMKIKMVEIDGGISFSKNLLCYCEGTLKNEKNTEWRMWELAIPEYQIKRGENGGSATLDEYVICEIFLSPVNKTKDEPSTSSPCEEAGDDQATAECELSGRQGGERPLEAQSHWCATPEELADQEGLAIWPTQAWDAVYDPPLAQAQPAGYNGQAPVQRPPIPAQFLPTAATPNPSSSGQMTMMAPPSNLGFPQAPLNYYYDHNYWPEQSTENAAYGMPPQQRPNYWAMQPMGNVAYEMPQQRQMAIARPPHMYFIGNGNDHAGAVAFPSPPYNRNPDQSSMAQAAGDQGEATAPSAGSGMRDRNGIPQQRLMAFAPPPPPQHMYFNGNANDHAEAVVYGSLTYNSHPDQSMMAQAAGDQGEATAPYAESGMTVRNVTAEDPFPELAYTNTCQDGARP